MRAQWQVGGTSTRYFIIVFVSREEKDYYHAESRIKCARLCNTLKTAFY